MVDANFAVTTWLQSNPAITALVNADNIFSPELPEGFSANIDTSPSSRTRAIVVKKRGGKPEAEIPEVIDPSIAIECWALEAPDAQQVYGAVRDMMHGATSVDLGSTGFVILCQEEVEGQDILDPETHWPYVLAYYHVKLRPGSSS